MKSAVSDSSMALSQATVGVVTADVVACWEAVTAVVTASTMESRRLALTMLFLTGVDAGEVNGVYLTKVLVKASTTTDSRFSSNLTVTVGEDAVRSTAVDTAGRTGVACSLLAGRGGVDVTLLTPGLIGEITVGVNGFLV